MAPLCDALPASLVSTATHSLRTRLTTSARARAARLCGRISTATARSAPCTSQGVGGSWTLNRSKFPGPNASLIRTWVTYSHPVPARAGGLRLRWADPRHHTLLPVLV